MNKSKDDIYPLNLHAIYCSCPLCEKLRNGEDITQQPPQQVQVLEGMDKQNAEKEIPSESDYTPDSLVTKQKDRIKELVDAHWSYMEKVLSTGQDKQQTFTWKQMMEIRKWDYTSSAIHFYGHGYEDAGKEEIQQRTLMNNDMFIKLHTKESK